MNNKVITNFGLFCLCIAGYFLFSIKSQVHDLSYQLSEISKQINDERNEINILKAEYSYLQSPNRIAGLVNKYLGLTAITTEQIVKDPLIAEENQPKAGVAAASNIPPSPKMIKKVSWRYKKPKNQNHISTVSQKGDL